MKAKWIPPAIALIFLAAAPVVGSFRHSDATKAQALARWDEDKAREERNASSIAIILGEFRANFSDLMFVKTERYLHSGVGYKPHLDTDKMASSGEISDRPKTTEESSRAFESRIASPVMQETAAVRPGEIMIEQEEEQEKEAAAKPDHAPTLIRTAENDFRGFLGDLEREVKPWRDPTLPHQHTAGTELLPWFRLATLGNPQNERAYLIGTWWLKVLKSETQLREGLKFIDEGIANNPESFPLHAMRGYLLKELKRDREALESFKTAAKLVFNERPADGKFTRDWTSSRDDLANGAWNMAIYKTRDLESAEKALELAKSLLARAPDSPVLQRAVSVMEVERLAIPAPNNDTATTQTATP